MTLFITSSSSHFFYKTDFKQYLLKSFRSVINTTWDTYSFNMYQIKVSMNLNLECNIDPMY